MADLYNFSIINSQSYCLQARAKDSNGNALSLTGYYITGGAKYHFSDEDYALNLNPTITDITGGLININLYSYQTSGLKTTVMPYNIWAYQTGIQGNMAALSILHGYISSFPDTLTNF